MIESVAAEYNYEDDMLTIPSYDGWFDEEEADDNKDKDWLPSPSENGSRSIKEIKEKFVRPLITVMDLFGLSIRGLHAVVMALIPKEAPSLATIARQIREVRGESLAWIGGQDFPQRGVLHFDGVKVKLGKKHGNQKIEHLAVTVTGLGKEYKIGLFETSSGTGSDHQEIFRYIHTPFQMNKTGVI